MSGKTGKLTREVIEAGERKPMSSVIEKLIKEKLPLTVTNYIIFAYWDKSSLDELEGEDLCEVLEMIEDGLLVDTESGAIN